MNKEMNLPEIIKEIKSCVFNARMYHRNAWKGRIINARHDTKFMMDVDFFAAQAGGLMGRARWWRAQIKQLYGDIDIK